VGDTIDVSAPRGSFVLLPGERPVVLLSAGIGVTPVLAMLHALSTARSTQPIWWIHAARDGQHHPFDAEARRIMLGLARVHRHVCYSKPHENDRLGDDYDAIGHLSQQVLDEIGIPRDADVYLCGPVRFMADMKTALANLGFAPQSVHAETFNGGESLNPGIVGGASRAPHVPEGDTGTGPLVSFAGSGVAAHWNPSVYESILELAEACDVPVRWSCRSGVCHNCESGLVSGAVVHEPDPLDPPASGNLLICCARPQGDVVIDI
jgi:ferredoxin